MNKRENQSIQLSDGRRLGFAEVGASNGKPVFYFHGWPSSRIEVRSFHGDQIAERLNVRGATDRMPTIFLH